jgi:outer membrane protein assembly factor BamE
MALAVLLASAGCVYEMPIQQGNHLDASTVAQVHAGMTRSQVRYLLGTPMGPDAFDRDRWEYAYYLKVRQLKIERRGHATVWFKDDLVDHVVSDVEGNHAEPVSSKPVTAPGA